MANFFPLSIRFQLKESNANLSCLPDFNFMILTASMYDMINSKENLSGTELSCSHNG